MNKKEQQSIKIKTVMKAINDKFNVLNEFVDEEGHGYFTGIIKYDDKTFSVDLSRRDFSVIVYEDVYQEFNKEVASKLEDELDMVIEDALQQAEQNIMMLNVNEGLGIR